ncbi:MAG: hypothetical protein SFV15_22305 [Polyangiaceae bacterium]|nr:hypothetical protein [Polyangiaceae bacterium]
MRTLGIVPALWLLSAPLHAQPKHRSDSREAAAHSPYVFDDELMQGNSVFPKGQIIEVRPLKGRAFLIRPRGDFLQELRKSVEDI